MFKRSRRKIVAAIMSVLVLLWIGTLCVIYASSYYEVSDRNRKMLEQYAALYALKQPPADMPADRTPLPGPGEPHLENTPAFQLSTFYSVALSNNGDILEISNSQAAVYDDEELEKIALDIIKRNQTAGTRNSLLYHMVDKGGYRLVAFMDNTIMQESITTLFRYTLIFGGIAIVCLYFLAVYLARRIVGPLEESYKKQRQFISDAGHELKTPVSVVNTNSELLAREIGENPWLSNIQYENERMGKLVNRLLELTRTENTASPMERLDFSHLVNGESLPFESMAFEKGFLLDCSITDHLFINGNSIQLKQLVSILLDNAICHSFGGHEIRLCLKEEHGFVKLSVTNHGRTIPQEQRQQLFDRFYRTDAARNGEDHHYGLGLSIAKAIVTAHNGKIGVTCCNGKIEFTVHIPASPKNRK